MSRLRTVILSIESSRSSGRQLLRGIARYARVHGPWRFFWEPAGMDELLPRIEDLKADGIIMRDSPLLSEVMNLKIPVILIEHFFGKNPDQISISTDSKSIGRMAADHLLDCGLKNFAYCGFEDKPWSIQRCLSFNERISIEGHEAQVYQSSHSIDSSKWQQEQKHLAKWLRSLPKPVGIMACNDDLSQHLLQACRLAELKVPEEVAIIGVDNDELICDFSDPPLSSVSVNFERAGYEGAAVLDRLINREDINNTEVIIRPTHVFTRHSTDVTVLDEPIVAEAVRFIRQNARQNICVDDVVRSSTISRRALEMRFRKHLNRSILEEIRAVRTNVIAKLLVETDMSITQIALTMGFNGHEHISRYFRRELNMNPLQYRKKFGRK